MNEEILDKRTGLCLKKNLVKNEEKFGRLLLEMRQKCVISLREI